MAATYHIHRELVGMPSVIGAMLIGFAFDSWWFGLGLVILSLYPYQRVYAAYFSDSANHPRRRDIPTNALFLSAQVVLWLIALFAVLGLKHVWRAI
jgi:hypothetical protein